MTDDVEEALGVLAIDDETSLIVTRISSINYKLIKIIKATIRFIAPIFLEVKIEIFFLHEKVYLGVFEAAYHESDIHLVMLHHLIKILSTYDDDRR